MERGIYTVLVTPFTECNEIDFESYDRLLDSIYKSKIEGVVVLGTTSESPTLNYNEKMILVKTVWKKFGGVKKVVIGIGGNNTIETLEFAKDVKDYCDYMMVTVPHYNKPSQEGIKRHFLTICLDEEIKQRKFILYNIPSRCGVNMLPDTIAEVYNECENIVAIKEATGSMNQVIDIRSKCDIQIFSGDDSLILPIMSVGGCGVISVIGNVLPDKLHDIYSLYEIGNILEAQNKFYQLYEAMKSLFIETNPVPTKALLQYINIFTCSKPRLPLVSLSDSNLLKVVSIFEKIKSNNEQNLEIPI